MREVWRKGLTVFHLDDVKEVGKVFEIELQKKGTVSKKDKLTFSSYQKKFKPYVGKVITGSNIDVVK
jgi:adenylate cyclase class IV